MGRLAGVSIKTVSRVFNDAPHVSEEVKQRVRDAAAALNYHPNVLAQALVRRRSHLIGLVYENPSASYVVDLQRGVLDRLKDQPYRLVVIPIPSITSRAGEVVGLLRSAALDAAILVPPGSNHPVILSQLASAGILCARIGPTQDLDQGCVTVMDDVSAARQIAGHLIGLGHRDIAIIKGDPTHPSVEARLEGYAQAFAAAGIEMRPDRIEPGLFTFNSGTEAGRRILTRADRPTAIIAMNDDMAVGALMVARELGIAIPDQLSIVGFDDSEIARVTWPRLTTIRQPLFEMAASATDMLVAALDGKPGPRRSDHPHELLVRESTGPVPPR